MFGMHGRVLTLVRYRCDPYMPSARVKALTRYPILDECQTALFNGGRMTHLGPLTYVSRWIILSLALACLIKSKVKDTIVMKDSLLVHLPQLRFLEYIQDFAWFARESFKYRHMYVYQYLQLSLLGFIPKDCFLIHSILLAQLIPFT